MVNKQISFYIEAEMVDSIVDYWYAKRLKNRSQSVRQLLEIGLNILEKNERIIETENKISQDTMNHVRVGIELKQELLDKIDDYWYKRRFMNRSQAITEILQITLESEDVKKAITNFNNSNK